jgi:hypothetical protein
MFFNTSNNFYLGNKPVSQIFFRDQTLINPSTTPPVPEFPDNICVTNSGSVGQSTYIYQPGFGGIPDLRYYSFNEGLTYYIRFNNNRYELIYFQSIFNQSVLYFSDILLGTWTRNNGILPVPVVTAGACPT